MTTGFLNMIRSQGVKVYPEREIPINWINFRMHPQPHWPGVEEYRQKLRLNEPIEPVVLCRNCLVILDGWHRVAAHWLEGRKYVNVVLADQHWMNGNGRCYVDKTNLIESIRNHFDMEFVSGAYRESDFNNPAFTVITDELTRLYREAGIGMPKMRLWEQARTLAFLGFVKDQQILDVGTRESLVPMYLANKGAYVTAIDLDTSGVYDDKRVKIMEADVRYLPFEDESFDHVISTACIKHIPGTGDKDAMTGMARVLKPGGLLAVTVDFGPTHEPYPSAISGRHIYNEAAVKSRLVKVTGMKLVKPVDFSVEWEAPRETWPIKSHAPLIWEAGYNLQVAFILLRKS